ncbi:recombinase family protein [Rhizobium laguerreae]|uniref:recombinase family protein n=1 Tax=Rhizobium laguerreae TaxID=1076926 RepID=UPI001C91C1A6|nr:recombinase family protein [Rhizobium laguerreae]MBY3137321.1 recombinase family protein [Rhizobium laguerreae]
MKQMRGVAYYRVSTDKQGRSGLGLDAQREAVRRFLGDDYPPVREFTEVESGKLSSRPELTKALAAAKMLRLPLVVAKVDRLARNVAFLEAILASGADVVFCDIPQVQGAMGRFILQQMAAVAQLEAGLISERTKAALKAAKERGKVLGGFRGVKVDPELGRAAKAAKASDFALQVAPIARELQADGASLRAVAAELTSRGIPTPRGGDWSAVQVKRVLERV